MSKICQITGKKAMIGNNVSHSKRRTKRTFYLNLFNKKFYYVEQDCLISLSTVSYTHRDVYKRQACFYVQSGIQRRTVECNGTPVSYYTSRCV